MTERQLAENICRVHARSIVDDTWGITMDGQRLAEGYLEQFRYAPSAYEGAQALRHWVESAGYDDDGSFKYIISNHILNC